MKKYAMNMMRRENEEILIPRLIVKLYDDETIALVKNDEGHRRNERYMILDVDTGILIAYTARKEADETVAKYLNPVHEVRKTHHYDVMKHRFIDLSASIDLGALIEEYEKRKEGKDGKKVSGETAVE